MWLTNVADLLTVTASWHHLTMKDSAAEGPYEIADRDLSAFVATWLRQVQKEDANSRGLLKHTDEAYDYGAHFLMSNIAPHAVDVKATEDTLLLYAVMAAYQNDGFPGAGAWQGEENHLQRAFEHARHLGAHGVASNLLQRLAERSTREPVPEFEEMLARSMGNDPAQRAEHDREIARINERDVRAAKLLDSSLSVDDFILDSFGGRGNKGEIPDS